MQGPKCQSKALSFFILADGGQTPPQMTRSTTCHLPARFGQAQLLNITCWLGGWRGPPVSRVPAV